MSRKQLNIENEAVLTISNNLQYKSKHRYECRYFCEIDRFFEFYVTLVGKTGMMHCPIVTWYCNTFPGLSFDGFGLTIGSISQPYCIEALMSFGIFYFPQSMEILVIPCAAKWKLIVQSDFPCSESCAWLSSIKKLLAGLHSRYVGFLFVQSPFFLT